MKTTFDATAALQGTQQPLSPLPLHPGLTTLTRPTLPPTLHPRLPHSRAQMSAACPSTPLGGDDLTCPEFFVPHSSDEQHARLIAARLIGERGPQNSDASARGSYARSNSAMFALNSHFSSQQHHKREQEQLQRELQLRRQMHQAAQSHSPMPLAHSLTQSRSNDDLQFSLAMHFRPDHTSRQHSRHSSLNSIGPVVEQKSAEPIVAAQETTLLLRHSSPTPMSSEDEEGGPAHAEERKAEPMELVTAPSTSAGWVDDAPGTDASSACDEASSSSSVVSDAPSHQLRAAWRVLCSHPELNRLARAHIDLLDVQMTAVTNALVERHNERMASMAQPLSEADRAAAASQFNAALDHLGRSFCEAGERVVELCHQRALRAAAVAAQNDLLYDQASPESSAQGSPSGSVDDDDGQAHSSKRARLSASDSPNSGSSDINEDTEDDEVPRRNNKRGGSKGGGSRSKPRGRQVKREPKVKIEGEDESDADDEEAAATSKPGVKRKQRSPETKGVFTETATAFLRQWLDDHLDDPYPDAEQKLQMSHETGLTYGQVQHWFINARMRYWRPLIAARKAELEASLKQEPQSTPPSLSDLSSAATHAAPMAAASDQPAAAGSSSLVPRSGRSYMLDPHRSLPSLIDPVVAAPSASGASAADLRAASVLSLSMASSYQTPHSYVDCHPLHPHRKYKSGGKNNKRAAAAATSKANSNSGSKTRSAASTRVKQEKAEAETAGHDDGAHTADDTA